jgi:uncharacterized protein
MMFMFSNEALGDALSPKTLHLILLPTEKCNFRCTYCYEDFKIGRMHPTTVNGIKRLLSSRVPALRSLVLSWFGGEPLLAKDILLDIGNHADALCRQYGVGFSTCITTNAYVLDQELFSKLLSISHRHFQITLDGDEEWHDKTRLLANRQPTFEVIWSNLKAYLLNEGKYRISLRLHVHRDNIESVKRLYRRVSDELLVDPRFSANFHKVSHLGAAPIKEGVLDDKDYLEALAYITNRSAKLESPASGISEAHLDGYICYAAKPNSLLIRANGRIGKCTVLLNDERNDIGHINEDGTLHIDNDKLRVWFDGFVDLSPKVLHCPVRGLGRAAAKQSKDFSISASAIGRREVTSETSRKSSAAST